LPGTRVTQGGPLSPKVIDHLQNAVEQRAGDGDLGHLETRVAGMRNNFPADFMSFSRILKPPQGGTKAPSLKTWRMTSWAS